MSLPNCDGCGKFTKDGIEYETPRPDFWNGPAVDLYCPRCAGIARSAWSLGFSTGRNADHNSHWWPKNPYALKGDES